MTNAVPFEMPTLALDLLYVDERYQRPLIPRKLEEVVANFKANLCGPLFAAGPDDDGRYAVWDGQRRLEALRRLGFHEWAVVVAEEDPATAAMNFVAANRDVVKVTPLSRHQALVFAGDDQAVELDQAVLGVGFKVGPRKNGSIESVASLEVIQRRFTIEVVVATLEVLRATYGDDPDGVSGTMIRGVGMFVGHHFADLDTGRVQEMLKKAERGRPRELLAEAKKRYGSMGASGGVDLYRHLVDLYNEGVGRAERLVYV